MTTAIAVYNSEGCVGRCDAKCHTAQPGTPCDCVCGGRLHATGSSGAAITKNTEDAFGTVEAARAWAREHGFDSPLIKTAPADGGRPRLWADSELDPQTVLPI